MGFSALRAAIVAAGRGILMPNEPAMPVLKVRAIRATPVEVPPNFILGTTMGAFRQVPLLLIDLETEEGVTGRSYVFCYLRAAAAAIASLVGEVERVIKGDAIDAPALWAKLARRFTLIGVQGVVRMAMSGFDVACWDALAIAAGQPLCRLLGAEPRPILAYNSCGLGLMEDLGALAAEAEQLLAVGNFRAVKLRLGYPTLAADIAAVHAVRKRIGEDVALMVDYNQALSLDGGARARAHSRPGKHLLARGADPPRRLRGQCAARARASRRPCKSVRTFRCRGHGGRARASQADIRHARSERIGGVTGWREAAKLAAVNRAPMSSHLFPEVSAHLLAATPTRHYLEYVDWGDPLVQEPLAIVDGQAVIADRPGNGMTWNTDAVARYRIDEPR